MKKKIFVLTVSLMVLVALLSVVLLSGCQDKGKYVEEDTYFYLDTKMNNDINFVPFPRILNLVLDPAQSYVRLGKDGSFQFHIMVLPAILKELNGTGSLLQTFNINVQELLAGVATMDLSEPAQSYAVPILPGFTFDDLEYSFGLLKSLEAQFIGLDFNAENVKKMADSVKETGHLNADLTLPDELGLEVNSHYEIVDIADHDGNIHKTIQVSGNPEERESYLVFEVRENAETGKRTLFLKVEFLQLTVYLTEK